MHNRTAILIGNQNFIEKTKLPMLAGPANDVVEMERILSDPTKGNFKVISLIDETSYNIKLCLEEVLSQAGLGDLVLIHYSGHGKIDKLGSLCLTASDTRTAVLQSTTIPARQLCYMISASDCETVILLLDCCYSGIAVNLHKSDVESQLRSLESAAGLFILAASSEIQTASEISHPTTGKKMGRFTYSIVEALDTGSADENQDGLISISELVRYLKSNVKSQTPQWFAANASGDPHISFNPAANRLELLAEMEMELYSDDFDRRTAALSYFVEIQLKYPEKKSAIKRLLEASEKKRNGVTYREPDYDSSRLHPPFVGWTPFSFGLPPNHPVVMQPVLVSGKPAYELRSSGSERIGLRRIFNFYSGKFVFRYRLISATGDNVQFHAVPMQYTGDLESYPWQTDRHLAYINNFFSVKDASIKFTNLQPDENWHEAELSFDFSSISEYVVVAFGPRINECSERRGIGHIQVTDIRLYGLGSTPSRHLR